MITAAQAKDIADDVNNGDPVNPAYVDESNPTGNLIIDELNHAVVWAAKKGEYTTYLAISKYPSNVVQTAITTVLGLNYIVSTTRLNDYKEIVLSWD